MKTKTKIITLFVAFVGIGILGSQESHATSLTIEPQGVTSEMLPWWTIEPKPVYSIQPVPLHTAEIVNTLNPSNPKKTGVDVLKFLHPTLSATELANMTAGFDESLTYLKNQGIKYTKVNKPLDKETVSNEIRNKRPVLAHLKANNSYWLEPESAVIIYGIQIYEFEGYPPNIMYYARSLNHSDSPIISGYENQHDLLIGEKRYDPSIRDIYYSWDSTAYGFTK
ncbi:MAG: hypothetical protein ACLR1F_08575 [Enterococcus avium]